MPISELCAEHRQLEAQARQMLAIVAGPVADAAAIAGLRWRMAQALYAHCEREDRLIYRTILSSGDAVATGIAMAYRIEHGQLALDFGRYITDWPVTRINREWDAFRADTQAAMAALAVRIKNEEETLYAHAERVIERRKAA